MDIILQGLLGRISAPYQLHCLDQIEQGNMGLIKDGSIPVLDTKGNLLVLGNKYTFKGKVVRIEEAKFGSGNILDTYYWVWYLVAESLDTERVTVEVSYKNKKATYQSQFTPIE